jgi:hypothetical protein
MSTIMYKRTIPVAIMTIIGIMFVAEYYIAPLQTPLQQPIDILSGWASIIASFTSIMAFLSLIRLYANNLRRTSTRQRERYLSIYGLVVTILTVIAGTIIYSPTHLFYMKVYFNIMLPLFFAAMGLNAFIMITALYRGFQAKNIQSAILLITCLVIVVSSTPVFVTWVPQLGDVYSWLMNVPTAGATRAFNIAVGVGMVGIALRTLTGQEKGLFGGE